MAGKRDSVVHVLLDSGHFYRRGDDSPEMAEAYAGGRHVHLEEVRRDLMVACNRRNPGLLESLRKGVFTVLRDGVIHFRPRLEGVGGRAGWLVVEAVQDAAKATPPVHGRKARAYLREREGM